MTLYYVFFIKHLWISKISLISILLQSTKKSETYQFNPVILILLTKELSERVSKGKGECLGKHYRATFSSKSFALYLHISTPLTNI